MSGLMHHNSPSFSKTSFLEDNFEALIISKTLYFQMKMNQHIS